MSTHFRQAAASETFEQEDVEEFAELSGDANPLHLDSDYAEETRFGQTIVHGALVASVISSALANLKGTVIYLDQDITFLDAVYPGEKVTAVVSEKDETGNTTEFNVVVESQDTLVIEGTATVMIE